MRGLLRWIFFAILIIVILLILVNVANKSKTKPKTSAPPTVYEKSGNNNTTDSDDEDGLVPIGDNTSLEQSVNVSDTASFSTTCIYIGMFILAGGAYYIYKKQIN